ncbi:MAG: hypothetical protein OQL19_08785 [Gammaproteobacteria bacterium]|nr:hypothetical protein [Gammaproteobacteria bacterium]
MSNKQIVKFSILRKTILSISIVWSSIVSGIICAERQPYLYASDVLKEKTNNPTKAKPFTFQNQPNSYQPQYSYPPPTKKMGSNPFFNREHNYQFRSDSGIRDYSDFPVNKNNYHYPPPIQKPGSNPFIK